MNSSLEPHGHENGAECADLHYALLRVIIDDEPTRVLRACLTIVDIAARHHPSFCIELQYTLGVAHELALDSDTAETYYTDMAEHGSCTPTIKARYSALRYEQLVIRTGTASLQEQEYFCKRALIAGDAIALFRRLGVMALR